MPTDQPTDAAKPVTDNRELVRRLQVAAQVHAECCSTTCPDVELLSAAAGALEAIPEATLAAHNQGYEQGRLAGMGVMVAILRRCEPFIAGLTRSHKPFKHDAQRLYDDIIGALKSAENTEDWRDHYTF